MKHSKPELPLSSSKPAAERDLSNSHSPAETQTQFRLDSSQNKQGNSAAAQLLSSPGQLRQLKLAQLMDQSLLSKNQGKSSQSFQIKPPTQLAVMQREVVLAERPKNKAPLNAEAADEESNVVADAEADMEADADAEAEADFSLEDLEAELELEDDSNFAERDGGYIDEMIEDESIDAEQDAEFLIDVLEGLFLELDQNKAMVDGLNAELNKYKDILSGTSIEELEDMDEVHAHALEISSLISRPLGDVEIDEADEAALGDMEQAPLSDDDILLQELESELEGLDAVSISSEMIKMYEDSVDRTLEINDTLETLIKERTDICRQITQLQVKLGILQKVVKKNKVSYKTRKKAKSGASKMALAAKYLVPVTSVPLKIISTSLAVISLAKTIKHIVNLKRLLQATKNEEVRELIRYAMGQKKQKAVKKGAKSVGLGLIATAQGGARAIYKKARGTKGKVRDESAKWLHNAARHGDVEAAAVVAELVGSNLNEAIADADGWEIVTDKLKSK